MGFWKKLKDKLITESETLDVPLNPVPIEKRSSWLGPAIVYAGVQFSFAVVMAGAGLGAGLTMMEVLWVTIIGLVILSWLGDSINAYLGAKTGLPGAVIARQSFGDIQARIITSLIMIMLHTGWWAINTSLVANAFCAFLNIDYTTQFLPWAIMVVLLGIIFIIPAVLGYLSMKWMDYIAVPAGILLFAIGAYLAIKSQGIAGIKEWMPEHKMPWSIAISTVAGTCVCQWAMVSDYSRMHYPTWRDSILMPSLLILVGFIEIILGAIMTVGIGTFDIVQIMVTLGYPFWAYLLLFIAQWTSQIVAVYSAGLSFGNMVNARDARTQKLLTLIIGLVGIVLGIAGILDKFMGWLLMLSIVFPPLAGIMTTDFFFLRNQQWEDIHGWNKIATISLIIGIIIGYFSGYKHSYGIPPLQAYLLTGISYYILMKTKASLAPDQFTPRIWLKK
ncbi:purine-cytosine permease-like transporter [Acetomicrobium mobile DSM 13181]|uniref:Purine-cytosine permease-like transporter n=1 Tax=Acetomicrobium mobile (strain ATCC BAA-54 / DSM 13181 / JCM 12221 / NGA) TaxID=891968 RepID=I4BZ05_ACEMN|nr:cytosine permease [Acetomicrobium mobile]AFM22512.1 purine-cytosine permease-like transporter [Acetomicrobium mobile DSM 13181]